MPAKRKPKVFIFCGLRIFSFHPCIAMAEDGTILATDTCNFRWQLESVMAKYGGAYGTYYPDGYEVVPVEDPIHTPSILAACERWLREHT